MFEQISEAAGLFQLEHRPTARPTPANLKNLISASDARGLVHCRDRIGRSAEPWPTGGTPEDRRHFPSAGRIGAGVGPPKPACADDALAIAEQVEV
jgi:hypothetical protein